MQRYTIFFLIVNAVHVSGGFSVHHQELKNCTHSIWYMSSLLVATASSSSKLASHIPDVVCTDFELLMMGGETTWNMYSSDNKKEYCITLHLVAYTWKNTLTMHGPMNFKLIWLDCYFVVINDDNDNNNNNNNNNELFIYMLIRSQMVNYVGTIRKTRTKKYSLHHYVVCLMSGP